MISPEEKCVYNIQEEKCVYNISEITRRGSTEIVAEAIVVNRNFMVLWPENVSVIYHLKYTRDTD